MTTDAEKAQIALTVYRDRGLAALQMMSSMDPKTFDPKAESALDEILRIRSAAFHNFAALDRRALSAGQDMASLPGVAALWNDVSRINREISHKLSQRSAKVEKQLAVGRKHNHVARHYHSGEPRPIRFVKRT